MKPDGTGSFTVADNGCYRTTEGNPQTEPDAQAGSEIKPCPMANATTWTYIFVHNSKVSTFEHQLAQDHVTYFVHKSVRYFRKRDRRSVQRREVPTVSGLIFFQGDADTTQRYLNDHFPHFYLCKNCSTGRVAEIPDDQMRPFMLVSRTTPERIRFLLHPFHYYARNRILLRITSGELAGLEGYVIRIDRDRRLVMDVNGMSVAISGVHAEKFEEAAPPDPDRAPHALTRRNLQERQALVDRYFHPVRTPLEADNQVENICFLSHHVATELALGRMSLAEAWSILAFIIEEIGFYYAAQAEQHARVIAPVLHTGMLTLRNMDNLIDRTPTDEDTRERLLADRQRLTMTYGYLFEGMEAKE